MTATPTPPDRPDHPAPEAPPARPDERSVPSPSLSGSASSIRVWIAAARQGDATARDRLFAACRNYLALLARIHLEGRLGRRIDASDLVQQTLLEAYRGFGRFQGQSEGEWLAWLRQVMAHNAADIVRHHFGTAKRQADLEVPLVPPGGLSQCFDPPDPGESPSQIAVQNEQEILLADAVAQLSEDYREVIILRNLQRLPFEEVAERMGRSRGAVQMLWMRAVERLRSLLE